MRFRLTRRTGGFLVAAFAVYALATNTEVVWLYLVAAMLVALVPVGVAGPWLVLRRVRVGSVKLEREGFRPPVAADRGKVFAGDTVRLRVALDLDCSRVGGASVDFGPGGSLRPEGALVGDDDVEVSLIATRRGAYRAERLRLTTTWPIGFATATVELPLDTAITVHPRYWIAPPSRRGAITVGALESRRRGMGDQFFSLREYRSGDPQRRIHWATTARTGTLMVTETEAEVDAGHVVELASDAAAGEAALDLAVSVAASYAARGISAGEPVRLEVGGVRLTTWREILAFLATFAGPARPGRGGEANRVRVTADAVEVDTGAGRVRLPAGTDLEAAERALAELA